MDPSHPETGAPAVVPPVIKPIVRGISERDRIITPYNADAFESMLYYLGLSKTYPNLPYRLRTGFPLGTFEPLTRSYTSSNHIHSPESLDFVLQYAFEQVRLGHMSGPYTQSEVEDTLGGPFMSSPVFLRPKTGSSGEYRVVLDCSSKNRAGFFVNYFIDPEDFPTSWGNAEEVARIVMNTPPGTQAATFDIDSAYRNIPILPDHKPFLVIQVHPHQFFIDHVCPFGPASGPGLQAQIMDAIVDILLRLGFGGSQGDVKVWVDDLISFRFPSGPKNWRGQWKYPFDIEDLFGVSRQLGIPWKRGKCFRYSSQFTYVGYVWDLEERLVALPEEKRKHCLKTVETFLDDASAGTITLKDTRSITGTLSHASFVCPWGRSYLASLHVLITAFRNSPTPPEISEQLVPDLQWWRDTLQQETCGSLVPRDTHNLDVWVDASTWGIGIIIGGRSAAWKLAADWEADGRDIGWAEMVALELACMYLTKDHKDVTIIVHCDNTGVIGAWSKGWSRNFHVNFAIRRAVYVCMSPNLGILPEYVESKYNKADRLSRGLTAPRITTRLPRISLPLELRQFLTIV